MRARAEYGFLTSAPGIGQVLATTILLETGPIERFAAAGNFASYARCVDSVHTSNGKKKGEGNTKNGNKYLAWAFVEAANFALRYCPEAKRFYERKKAKTNNVVAIKALAHKLARACFHMLKEKKPFAAKADRPQREPARDWRRNSGNHGSVIDPLDTVRHQRFSGAVKPPGRQAASSPFA